MKVVSYYSRRAQALTSQRARSPKPTAPYFRYKPLVARLIGVLLLPFAAIAIVFFGILVCLTSKGPAIYRQKRVGRGGRLFVMYKLRTMRHDAEVNSGPVWAERDDPRVTSIGKFLRRFHLDELPQVVNVLQGDMDLVGPRPERPEFTQELARRVPRYLERSHVLPGVTGLAQINLPPDSDLKSVQRKLSLDLMYLRTATFWLDLRLFLATLLGMFGLKSAFRARMLYVARQPCDLEFVEYEPTPCREWHIVPRLDHQSIGATTDVAGSSLDETASRTA